MSNHETPDKNNVIDASPFITNIDTERVLEHVALHRKIGMAVIEALSGGVTEDDVRAMVEKTFELRAQAEAKAKVETENASIEDVLKYIDKLEGKE